MALNMSAYLAAVRRYFNLLFDSAIAEPVTLRSFVRMVDDPELKRQVPQYQDHTILALNCQKGWDWGQEGRVFFNRSRADFLIRNEDLPAEFGVKDLLVAGGTERKINAFTDHFGVVTSISLEGSD